MRTDELINTLVADHAVQPRPKPVGHGLVMAIIGGLAISGALFALTLGVRPDIVSQDAVGRKFLSENVQ